MNRLVVGETYFSVFYMDEKLTAPIVERFVDLGEDRDHVVDADGLIAELDAWKTRRTA